MDDKPLPGKLRDRIIERGRTYLHAIEHTLDPQSRPPRDKTVAEGRRRRQTGAVHRYFLRLRAFLTLDPSRDF